MDFLKGKKTFLAVGVFALLAIATLIANLAVPEWAWTLVAGFGLGFIRSAITDLSGNAGWKTYAAVVATVGLGAAQAFGITLSPDVLTGIFSVLGAFGIVGVRAALAKIPKT